MGEIEDLGESGKTTPKKADVLSFAEVGRELDPDGIAQEFRVMRDAHGKPVEPAIVARVAKGSGTHLLKLITSRARQNVVRISKDFGNVRDPLIPSVNAPDIPVAKILFRPLEIHGYPSRSLVEHILEPDGISEKVTAAFSEVFGSTCFETLESGLGSAAYWITRLPVSEFPIIFVPSPTGGDLQLTPLSPAAAYTRMRDVVAPYFAKREKDAPQVPRGSWSWQEVSDKPQNISGMIGKTRIRFHAGFPRVMGRLEAEIHRYLSGGRFPRLRHGELGRWVLEYADLLDQEAEYSNSSIRKGLDRRADALIREAREFTHEILEEVRFRAPGAEFPAPPSPGAVLLQGARGTTVGYDRARRVLSGTHFRSRVVAAETAS